VKRDVVLAVVLKKAWQDAARHARTTRNETRSIAESHLLHKQKNSLLFFDDFVREAKLKGGYRKSASSAFPRA
jgi:hypothetical protein